MKLFYFIFVIIIGGCASNMVISKEMHSIQIDKGTVYLSISENDMSKPHIIKHRAQGQCIPEVDVSTDGNRSVVKHVKDCHGKGRNEGTVFDIILSKTADHTIVLNAGQIFSPKFSGSEYINSIQAKVKVGGIHGDEKAMNVRRKALLGAQAHSTKAIESHSGIDLILNVKLGGIDFN